MKTRTLILCAVLLWYVSARAQNLVVNPGFETYKKGSGVPDNAFATYGVAGWYQPTLGSADWYCDLDTLRSPFLFGSGPQYFAGKISPHSGNCFAGFHAITKSSHSTQAEYTGGTLTTALEAGHTYSISFWVALGQNSDMNAHQLQMYFSYEKTLVPNTVGKMDYNAQLSFDVDTIQMWTLVKTEFIARGGETFFIVGNFSPDFQNSSEYRSSQRNSFFSYAYYYVDDFSVVDKNPNGALSIVPGSNLVFHNIYFETGQSVIQPESFATLNQIVDALKKQSTLKVQISGHTDSDGDPKANQTLSEQRAISVKNYFITKGIDSTRITTKGFGSSQPIGTDKSKNRRVEFVFSDK